MKQYKYKNSRKEKLLMVTASALVLGVLTTTGMVMREQPKQDNVIIDFTALEESNQEFATIEKPQKEIVSDVKVREEELGYEEANSGTVYIPQLNIDSVESKEEEDKVEDVDRSENKEKLEREGDEEVSGEVATMNSLFTGTRLQASDTLQWPVVGNILLNYSMDETVYFETLAQYKYNPAIMIEADPGDLITSASAGIVESVVWNEEIGNTIEIKIDDTYRIRYGQLDHIAVGEGDIVEKGTILGEVGEVTKYYSKEGNNVYFELIENGTSIDPMSKLE